MSAKTATEIEMFKLIAKGVPRDVAAARVQAEQSLDPSPAPYGNFAKGRRLTPRTA